MKGAVAVTFDFHFSDHVTFQSAHRFWPQLINGGLLLVECRRLHRLTACIRCATLRYAPASLGPRALAGVAARKKRKALRASAIRAPLLPARADARIGEECMRAPHRASDTLLRACGARNVAYQQYVRRNGLRPDRLFSAGRPWPAEHKSGVGFKSLFLKTLFSFAV